MLIYRIEHKETGKGPYTHPWDEKAFEDHSKFIETCSSNKHRTIEEDVYIGNDFFLFNLVKTLILMDRMLTKQERQLLSTFNFDPRFCTTTKEQLASWFNVSTIISLLNKQGFNLVTYEVEEDNLLHLKTQSVIIDNEKAICVNCESITVLHSI